MDVPSKETSMDMDDLTPAGSGSLRSALRPGSVEPVAAFTPTRTRHPDEICELEHGRPWRGQTGLGEDDHDQEAERDIGDGLDISGWVAQVGASVRSTLRGGAF
jgi:hypothetical protein